MSYPYGSYFFFQLPYVMVPDPAPALPLITPECGHDSLALEAQFLRLEQQVLLREIEDHK